MLDERARRLPSFRQGTRIRLGDGQAWEFPGPPKGSDWNLPPFGVEYRDLINAILESQDAAENRLAQLAFAILLLGHNYQLSSAEYEQLLDASPESAQGSDWQIEFQHIAQAHVQSALEIRAVSAATRPFVGAEGGASRGLQWIQNRLRSRWLST
jgi:hypothetical protein